MNIREAADRCGVSVDTVRRRLRGGAFPNARQVAGAWEIPSADLEAADMLSAPSTASLSPESEHIADLRAEIIRLHELLAISVANGRCAPCRAENP